MDGTHRMKHDRIHIKTTNNEECVNIMTIQLKKKKKIIAHHPFISVNNITRAVVVL